LRRKTIEQNQMTVKKYVAYCRGVSNTAASMGDIRGAPWYGLYVRCENPVAGGGEKYGVCEGLFFGMSRSDKNIQSFRERFPGP
jgi:hypothetical protein